MKTNVNKISQVLSALDKCARVYKYGDYVEETMEKEYNYIDVNRKLFGFAQSENGTISDCFILYAISILGVADRESIQIFLKNMKKRYSELYIGDVSNSENIRVRIANLKKMGYVFASIYRCDSNGKDDSTTSGEHSLYTIDVEGNELMNRVLSKRMPYNRWLAAMSPSEMIGWGCASYVGACLSHHSNFVEYLDGAFRARNTGTYIFPSEIKFFNGVENHYVVITPSYLRQNKKTQTELDYAEYKVRKVNLLRNYLDYRTKKGVTDAVICVENTDDLKEMTRLIFQTENLVEYLPRIYFTGEGILRNSSYLEESFVRIKGADKDNPQISYELATPDFFKKI